MNYQLQHLIKIALLYLLALVTGHLHAQESIRISGDLACTPLDEDVYLITHYFPRFGSNSLYVHLGDNKGLLIDTPHETTGTRALLDWIDSIYGGPELIAINTGWHQDNLGGNECLRSRGIDVYGPDLTANLIQSRADELKALLLESTRDLEDQHFHQSYLDLRLVPPNILFSLKEGLILDRGGETIEVYFPGESHTIDNTVVYLHKKRILFGGCMILSLRHQRPGFIEHANMNEWPLSVAKVRDRFPYASMVIPGHGPPGDTTLYGHTITLLNEFNAENPPPGE